MLSKWQVLQFYVFSSIVTLNFRCGSLGTERLRNLPWIPWLVCGGGNLTLETLLLTAVCGSIPVSYFYHHLILGFGILDAFLLSSVSNLSDGFYHSQAFISCLPWISLMRQVRLDLEIEDDAISSYDPLFGLCLRTEAGDDNGSHVRCRPEGLSCHFRKH